MITDCVQQDKLCVQLYLTVRAKKQITTLESRASLQIMRATLQVSGCKTLLFNAYFVLNT